MADATLDAQVAETNYISVGRFAVFDAADPECLCITLTGGPDSEDDFEDFLDVFTAFYRVRVAHSSPVVIYDIREAEVARCAPYVARMVAAMGEVREVMGRASGVAVLVASDAVRTLLNGVLQLFDSGAPRRVFSGVDKECRRWLRARLGVAASDSESDGAGGEEAALRAAFGDKLIDELGEEDNEEARARLRAVLAERIAAAAETDGKTPE